MRILTLTNLYPPHHAGTHDLRCQQVCEGLRLRGHEVLVLTSNHGLTTEQRDGEHQRRLLLHGAFGHEEITHHRELTTLEEYNHGVLREVIASYQPDLVHVGSLHGLSKSLVFTLHHARRPVVYDVGDDWIANGLRADPWLRWWNNPGRNLTRAGLEMAGQRNRLDATAPTRLVKGLDRIPELYTDKGAPVSVPPNSIAAFRFDRIYFCSQALKRATGNAGFQVQHAEVFPPGIPTQSFIGEVKPLSAPVRKFLLVARLDAASGAMTALQALAWLRQNRIEASLTLCGRGESEHISRLKSFAVQNSLPTEFVTLSNQNRDLAAVYRQHDALLYTAEWEEPFSTVPLEAMACGLPVIGARIGGANELFRHGENCLTFAPGEASELATRMQELQLQPALRRQMGETAQSETLEQFNDSASLDRIENYFTSSLELWIQG